MKSPPIVKLQDLREIPSINIQAPGKSRAPTPKLQSCCWGHKRSFWLAVAFGVITLPSRAHASLLHGETLDAAANVLAWVVLVVAPAVAIAVFWLVHILPEKIAEKKRHPQAKAIQTLCLLSLVFGGMLWPIAWLWAYTKPVLHKMAYGTDVDETHGHVPAPTPQTEKDEAAELKQLRARVAELENRLSRPAAVESEKI